MDDLASILVINESNGAGCMDVWGLDSSEVQSIEGFSVFLVDSGEQAVEVVKSKINGKGRFYIVFLEVTQESLDHSFSIILAIQAADPTVYFVIVSDSPHKLGSSINPWIKDEFKDQWDYLIRPFTKVELLQKSIQMAGACLQKRRLEQLNRQILLVDRYACIGRLAKSVGHEFSNILQRIIGKVDISLMETELETIFNHLKIVLSATERASIIVRNLQSFYSSETDFKIESVGVPLEVAISLMGHELVRNSIDFERSFSNIPSIRLNVGSLSQVFLNIMIHSVRIMHKSGKILAATELATRFNDKYGVNIKFYVSSPGGLLNVSSDEFDLKCFLGGGSSQSNLYELGLAASRQIALSHGGDLFVEQFDNNAATFCVWLPLLSER